MTTTKENKSEAPDCQPDFTHRNLTFRLKTGTMETHRKLMGLAGACRFAWNAVLGEYLRDYEAYESDKGVIERELYMKVPFIRNSMQPKRSTQEAVSVQ